MSRTTITKEEKLPFTIKVQLEQALEQKLPKGMVYAYDRKGTFLDATDFPPKARFTVKLSLPSVLHGDTVRILLGPKLSDDSKEMPTWMRQSMRSTHFNTSNVSPSVLVRNGAYEKRIQLDTEDRVLLFNLFPHDWKKWIRCRCVVKGRLLKSLQKPDETNTELGVYNACIRIYEVDKLSKVIARLPDRDLLRIRDDLLTLLKNWPPNPPLAIIPSIQGPRVGPPPPLSVQSAKRRAVTAHNAISPGPQREPPDQDTSLQYEHLATLIAQELESVFMAFSASQLRNALIVKADILNQLICQWKWLHFHFSKDLIKCVATDEQGKFETTITYPNGGDKPDLYFKAVQCIACDLHTLYDPNVACNTHWNYECGNEIILVTTNPAAITCMSAEKMPLHSEVSTWLLPYAVKGKPSTKNYQPKWLTSYDTVGDAPFGTLSTTNLFFYRCQDKKDIESRRINFMDPAAQHHHKEKSGKLTTQSICATEPKSIDTMHLHRFRKHRPEMFDNFIPKGYHPWEDQGSFKTSFPGNTFFNNCTARSCSEKLWFETTATKGGSDSIKRTVISKEHWR